MRTHAHTTHAQRSIAAPCAAGAPSAASQVCQGALGHAAVGGRPHPHDRTAARGTEDRVRAQATRRPRRAPRSAGGLG
eukprot:6618730-Prymnesium_polylepis.1